MDKPFRTIDEQASILRSRGLTVDRDSLIELEREGYYQVVNGYKDPFLEPGSPDRYRDGASLHDIYRLFLLDRELRMVMFRCFSIAESVLKSVCAYQFALENQSRRYPYLDQGCYSEEMRGGKQLEKLIKAFESAIGRCRDGAGRRKPYIDHYVNNHDEVPIWVAMKCLTLGQAFKFYCFQPESTRNAIAKRFGELYGKTHSGKARLSQKRIRLAYDHIKDFRNICAHEERLYCARVSPSMDTPLAAAIKDLGLILTGSEGMKMTKEIVELLLYARNDMPDYVFSHVLSSMGISDIGDTFSLMT